MRPTRLELEGFASFRDKVEVDFADADLFVLSGHTGAGKSSIVDAIVFALYGTVPRYDDRRMVAPIISQGRAEARVRLDFTVGGRAYTAVRVVRRTRTGATTKEARLERWRSPDGSATQTLAGTADELTAEVERLLGLRFDHFTSCIVLPQGTFQQFLHSKPKERQDLLVQLLDLDVYRTVGSAARDRATAAQATADSLQRRLDAELADATEDAVEAAAARVGELDALVVDLDRAQPGLDDIRQRGVRLREQATTARERADLLAGVAVPDGVEALAERLAAAQQAVADADAAVAAAAAQVEQATGERQQAGDPAPLSRQLERLADRDRALTERHRLDEVTDRAARDEAQAQQRLTEATAVLADARAARDRAQRHDLVAAVVADHAVGDPCPVCDRPLDRLPDTSGTAVADATTAVGAAEQQVQAATQAHRQAATAHTRATTEREGVVGRLASLEDQVREAAAAGVPDDPDALRRRLADLTALDERVASARRAEQAARTADRQARADLQQVHADSQHAWRAFDDLWQQLAELGPPRADRDDLAGAWSTLAAWAAERRPRLLGEAEQAEREVAATADRWKAEAARLRDACRAHDVLVRDGEAPRDAARRDAERARSHHETLQRRVAESERLRRQLAGARRDQRLAHQLGLHLKSSSFEKWLLNRALRRLVVGATHTLHDLSDGAYSLTLDDGGGFAVIDHRNADETRSARTLSGGETFLASLALALSLSEHVADLAAEGAARLESLILDEGFGTLDAETLDVVAAALEELGSRGRMVGVITHVGALAQRLPVRYDVRKEAGTSTVTRVAG